MNISGSNFRIYSIQFSIFTPKILFNKNEILKTLMESFSEKFDGDTISIPVSDNVPESVPEIILNSKDNKFKLQVTKKRVDIHLFSKNKTGVDPEQKQFLDFCLELVKKYENCTQATIGRLAIVINKFLLKEKPGLELAKHFCKEHLVSNEPFNRPAKFEIHSLKKYSFEEFDINSWVRCQNGSLSYENEELEVIVVKQDINTLSENLESCDFHLDEIKKFITVIPEEQTNILNKYFP